MISRPLLALAVLVAGAIAFVSAWAVMKPPMPAPPAEGFVAEAPQFEVRAQDGTVLKNADLRGRAYIANFVFTRCTTVCPVITTQFAELHRTLPPGVRLISFSVDPGYDTPEVLTRFATASGADGNRWRFVTFKSSDDRNAVVRAFLLSVQNTPEDKVNPILHDGRFVLVDGDGMVKGFYDGTDADAMKKLRKDAIAVSMKGLYGLPMINAALNATSAILLAFALTFIRRKKEEQHVAFIFGALLASTLFLASYLWYHGHAGSTKFAGTGPAKTAYLALLLSHTILAACVPIMVGITIAMIARGNRPAHRRWARMTVPVWGYVSLTGVAIYWILFRT